jgi:hypothetical protein
LWSDRIVQTRIKINRGHLKILGVYAPTKSREDLNEEFYETLQKILDKVNRYDYMLLTGDRNYGVGNNTITNIVGTNGETSLNNNGKKMIDFCTFNNLNIMNAFFKHKEIHKFTWEARGHKSIINNL